MFNIIISCFEWSTFKIQYIKYMLKFCFLRNTVWSMSTMGYEVRMLGCQLGALCSRPIAVARWGELPSYVPAHTNSWFESRLLQGDKIGTISIDNFKRSLQVGVPSANPFTTEALLTWKYYFGASRK